jgi:hypothetical protein
MSIDNPKLNQQKNNDLEINDYLFKWLKKNENKNPFDKWFKESKEELAKLNIDRILLKLKDIEINASNYEEFKKDFKELFNQLNNNKNLIDSEIIDIDELLEDIKSISLKLTNVISIKLFIKKILPDYKWNNILELTHNAPLDENFINWLENNHKDIIKKTNETYKIDTDEQLILNLVKQFHEIYETEE